MRVPLAALCILIVQLPRASVLTAQEPARNEARDRVRTTPAIGLTGIPLGSQWGGGLKAATASIGVSMRAIRESGVTLSARALVPVEGRAAIPVCVPDAGGCKEYRTPDVLFDFAAGAFTGSKDGKLRGSVAVGWLHASGLLGAPQRSSSTLEAGAEVAPLGERRFAPIIGLHIVYMTRSIAGARTVLVPSVGLSF